MYIFLLIFALVILFVVGSATAMRYFDKPKKSSTKKSDETES